MSKIYSKRSIAIRTLATFLVVVLLVGNSEITAFSMTQSSLSTKIKESLAAGRGKTKTTATATVSATVIPVMSVSSSSATTSPTATSTVKTTSPTATTVTVALSSVLTATTTTSASATTTVAPTATTTATIAATATPTATVTATSTVTATATTAATATATSAIGTVASIATAIPSAVPTASSVIAFANVEQMKAAGSLNVGDSCMTLGYYQENDGGSASYQIVKDATLTDDGFTVINIVNGLKAVLSIPADTIHVMTAGIRTGDTISSRLNYVLGKTTGKCKKIIFAEGKYYFDKPVYLQTFQYQGTVNTEFVVTQKFATGDNKIFETNNAYICTGKTLQVEFYNLTFKVEATADFALKSREMILMCMTGIDHCVIDQCKFIATQATTNGAYAMVDLLWFRDSSFNDITISNSAFENTTCIETGTAVRVGGQIWFWGGAYDKTITNVNIKNCSFLHSTTDEVIAIWQCDANNINIDACKFTVQTHHSDNIIALNDMYFKNVNITNSDFYLNATCTYPIKTYKDFSAQLNVNKCRFYLNNGVKSPWVSNVSMMYLYNTRGTGESLSDCYKRATYNVSNCEVYSANGTQYRTFVTPRNVKVNITNIKINANLCGGIAWIENGFADVTVDGGSLNMQNNDLANIKTSTDMTNLTVKNCTITQSVKLYLYGSVAVNYVMTGCNLIMKSQNFYIISEAKALSGFSSSYSITGNTVTNPAYLLKPYGSLALFTTKIIS